MSGPDTPGGADWPGQDLWKEHLRRLGGYIKAQRQFGQLSQRQLADMANLSDTYMSQLERGLHEPSIRVLRALATSLGLDPDDLVRRATTPDADVDGTGPADPRSPEDTAAVPSIEVAVRHDTRLSDAQKRGLLAVLQSYLAEA